MDLLIKPRSLRKRNTPLIRLPKKGEAKNSTTCSGNNLRHRPLLKLPKRVGIRPVAQPDAASLCTDGSGGVFYAVVREKNGRTWRVPFPPNSINATPLQQSASPDVPHDSEESPLRVVYPSLDANNPPSSSRRPFRINLGTVAVLIGLTGCAVFFMVFYLHTGSRSHRTLTAVDSHPPESDTFTKPEAVLADVDAEATDKMLSKESDATSAVASVATPGFVADNREHGDFSRELEAAMELAKRDPKTGMQELHTLASSGCLEAWNALAMCFAEGRGTKQDYEAAAYCWRAGSDAGDPVASYWYGLALAHGHGTGQDLLEARQRLSRSLEGGYEPARQVLEAVDALLAACQEPSPRD